MKKLFLSITLMGGLISAQASVFLYNVSFSSAGEALPSVGTGSGTVTYDDVAHTLALTGSFSGLQGFTTASHIHAATTVPFTGNAGVATTTPTFAGFPLGVSSGTYVNTLDLTLASSYNPAFVTANASSIPNSESALAAAMASGRAYWNIHSTYAGGGEIRGFLTAVPEPSSLALLALGALGVASVRRKK